MSFTSCKRLHQTFTFDELEAFCHKVVFLEDCSLVLHHTEHLQGM